MKRKGWVKGVNVTVSPEAHKLMNEEVLKSKVIKSLRQYVNVINNLSGEL